MPSDGHTSSAPAGEADRTRRPPDGVGEVPDRRSREAEIAGRFRGRIRLFAARRLKDSSAAEDVAQETLRRVIEALREDRIEDPGALPAYVFRTARHVCLHHHRSIRRERRALKRVGNDRSSRPSEDCPPDPLTGVVAQERARTVRRALSRLSERDRRLLRLFFWEDRETSEVARRLEISRGAVRVRKHRALKRLWKELVQDDLDERAGRAEPGSEGRR